MTWNLPAPGWSDVGCPMFGVEPRPVAQECTGVPGPSRSPVPTLRHPHVAHTGTMKVKVRRYSNLWLAGRGHAPQASPVLSWLHQGPQLRTSTILTFRLIFGRVSSRTPNSTASHPSQYNLQPQPAQTSRLPGIVLCVLAPAWPLSCGRVCSVDAQGAHRGWRWGSGGA